MKIVVELNDVLYEKFKKATKKSEEELLATFKYILEVQMRSFVSDYQEHMAKTL